MTSAEYEPPVNVPFLVKHALLLLLPLLFLAGCKTSTIDSRKQERAAAYARLPADQRADVDAGRIRVGMNTDAVYISWGKPAQILQGGTEQGQFTTWLYEGGWMQEERYWAYRTVGTGRYACAERYLARDYYPRAYISAEVNFQDGVVREWRTLPRPIY
ncbi:MAG: hypothetical protein MUC91_10900 [Verrucomicrobia bacterium]|jgi:hypothetical protein|nr:hypothetical protein [Verrucomicrobiota bacterium]